MLFGLLLTMSATAGQEQTWTGCLDKVKVKMNVDAKLKSPFFRQVVMSYPWHIVEREDGSLEDALDGEIDDEDRVKVEHTAKVTSDHQGKHEMERCEVSLKKGVLEFTVWGGLPAYVSELRIELQEDGRFQCVFDAESPAPGPDTRWRITKKKLVFQKRPSFKPGERLRGWISVEFDEISIREGKEVHTSHKIEGYLKPVVSASE